MSAKPRANAARRNAVRAKTSPSRAAAKASRKARTLAPRPERRIERTAAGAKRAPVRASNAPKPRTSLKALQVWMQEAVVGPHEGRAADAQLARAHILPSKSLAPDERVEIYTTMYRLRMLEALAVDFPALRRFLGPEGFDELMVAYLRAHPSRHYSLNFLGYALPEFLSKGKGAPKLRQRAFLADVARVENTITIVFDEPESPRLDAQALAQVPPEAWERARIELIRAARLLELDHAANAAVSALRNDREAPITKRTKSWIVVYRKEWVVWRMDLEHAAFAVLAALRAGRTLPQAIEAGAEVFDGTPDELQGKVRAWFADWVAEGLFSAVKR